jgi:hypothetical protein
MMGRRIIALLLQAGILTAVFALPAADRACEQAKPDTRKAQALHWPDAADLARLRSVEGKPASKVLEVLGHPAAVSPAPDGTQVWDYPWLACCRVWLKDGVCVDTYYTAGY